MEKGDVFSGTLACKNFTIESAASRRGRAVILLTTTEEYSSALRSSRLSAIWKQCLDGWEGATASERASVLNTVASLRDRFLAILSDVADMEERESLTAVFYVLVRSQWILRNIQSGYQLLSGDLDRGICCESGMLSALLGAIEQCMLPENVARLTGVLSQPVVTRIAAGSDDAFVSPMETSARSEEVTRLSIQVRELQNLLRGQAVERETLEAESASLLTDQQLLETHLGFSDAASVVSYVMELRSRLGALEELQEMMGGLEQTEMLLNI